MEQSYKAQVELLVNVLPYIAKEDCFALKGGTAINLFYSNMPRLSVDIDLSYIRFDDRTTAYKNINEALERIALNLNNLGFQAYLIGNNEKKILCSNQITRIKVEPNYIIRGYTYNPELKTICEKTQDEFGFAEIKVVSKEELFGGKICAALDRQHPRDLFDIKELLDGEGLNHKIIKGFLVMLLSHDRPLHEVLKPNIIDQELIWKNEFLGMTDKDFSYQDHLETFKKLNHEVVKYIKNNHKQFLLDFVQLKYNWVDIDIPNIDKLPAIRWKLKNLESLKNKNVAKFKEQYSRLLEVL